MLDFSRFVPRVSPLAPGNEVEIIVELRIGFHLRRPQKPHAFKSIVISLLPLIWPVQEFKRLLLIHKLTWLLVGYSFSLCFDLCGIE